MSLPQLPAERHRVVAGAFTEKVSRVEADSWDAPSPVAGWAARDVVRHLTDWLAGFLSGSAGIDLARGPSVDDDPVGAWQVHAGAVQALLDEPVTASQVLKNPHLGEMSLERAVDMIYTTDVFLHSWDLARATGQDDRLDPEVCAELVEGMEQMEDVIRSSGQYGPRVEVPEGSDAQIRLIGFIGRDPFWTPPGG